MNVATVLSIILWFLKFADALLNSLDRQQLMNAGKAQAYAEVFASIMSKMQEAKKIDEKVDRMSDADVADFLRRTSKATDESRHQLNLFGDKRTS